jgi:hypothetical protein
MGSLQFFVTLPFPFLERISPVFPSGLLQSRFPSSQQRNERFIEVIGKIAPGMSDIGLTSSSKEAKHDIVEDRQHFRRMAQTNLSMIFLHGDIASMMQPILNAPMTRASM